MTRLAPPAAAPECAVPEYAGSDLLDASTAAVRASVGLPVGARVVAAMSGGVDSSVTAALLARAGYEVVGVTLQLYDHGAAVKRAGSCCAGQDVRDARAVADRLGIAHYVLDYESRFRESVIDDFADAYLRGETPIPCVRCNQTVKFRDLLEVARDLGAEAMATGHYVRRRSTPAGVQMLRGADPKRDQSYFLFATTRQQLDYLRFPLGDLPKATVREVAAAAGLVVARKPDSQDICFVPEGNYATLIDRLRPHAAGAGEVVHVDGRVLGRHAGVTRYTIGQRRGLGVAVGEPLFVTRVDADRKRVVVGPREALAVDFVTLREVNWLGEEVAQAAASDRRTMSAQVRSTGGVEAAEVLGVDAEWRIRFAQPLFGVAPGQACVLYEGDRVLGGGFIAATSRSADQSGGAALKV